MKDLSLSKNNFGKAVIANKRFLKSEKILTFEGKLMHRSELPPIDKILLPEEDRYLQIPEEDFIGPSGKIDDFINHSCSPNAGVIVKNKRAELFALRNIEAGEEITYDYSPLMYDEKWTMKCACGSSDCRKIIKEFKYLSSEIKQKYRKLGIVPEYNLKML
jgi:hypothetical protein